MVETISLLLLLKVQNFSVFNSPYNIYYYNEAATGTVDKGWTRLFAGTLVDKIGYLVAYNSDITKSFSGQMFGGNQSLPVTYTVSGGATEDGWNLVGNPFASAVDWDAAGWTKTNLNSDVAVWDGTQYHHWNGTTGSLTDGIIPAHQGFWVQANASSPVLTVPQTGRIHSAQAFYAAPNANEFALKVEGPNTITDKIFISFRPDATLGFDNHCDGRKLEGMAYAPQLWSCFC
ncbi:MAG: hypothetical protein MZU79_02270 [Anaerotruncus sp.]|nr:hypothetical protein [Anaerotruncus sp.]